MLLQSTDKKPENGTCTEARVIAEIESYLLCLLRFPFVIGIGDEHLSVLVCSFDVYTVYPTL